MTNPTPTRAEVEALKMRPVRRKHVFHGPEDHANSWESDSCQACVLSLCKVCRGAEASLPTDCPGRKMTCEEEDAVQNGTLDFVRDCWVVPRAYAATLVPQEAPIDWQAESDRIYKETGGVTPKLREAYEFYKRTQAAPVAEGMPDFDALATDALRSVDKGVGYKHHHACVKANLIAAYELGWTAARAPAEAKLAEAKRDLAKWKEAAEINYQGAIVNAEIIAKTEAKLAEAKHGIEEVASERELYRTRWLSCVTPEEATRLRERAEAAQAELATVKAQRDESDAALTMFADKAKAVQDNYGDPSSFTHNALLTVQLVFEREIAEAIARHRAAQEKR